ncbi:Acyl-CoA dehydrogenase [Sphingobium herbicidovorans NBRC 16415]|uniref:Acyl-CoA dehydrogenase n=1 Tax=Sphingobium herbicidovorans (strain ATCC 700291 / DSM 11019 / CCUG 56400 / KCTC 2939 / LMG 18315 / NBRC 16415 / MH) TaxID=1219045 RepID=A0A086PBZ5_SPHHM|nr:acyl-CoA dehydrogenase [Sphingobium herbicidovorans]KFG90913.1 Acyl-CoA dehydrogenase [Sphingobium herbicidovorans NBRC 16415]
MNDDNEFLVDSFRRQLADVVTSENVRSIEAGDPGAALWQELKETGYLDATVPEDAGGAGLSLAQLFPLISAAGEYALPLPFAETMVARGLAASHGLTMPDYAIVVLAGAGHVVPGARFATHALVEQNGALAFAAMAETESDLFGTGAVAALKLGSGVSGDGTGADTVQLAAAAVASAQMAGAMARVLDMTISFAGERQQFGRPLGKFQAIQQQLAVLAEQVISSQVAARGAFAGARFDRARVAAAKCRTSEAVTIVCNIAHAVHGAIGVTAEFDLQLYTRRLKQWQLAFGSESYWARKLGRLRVAAATPTTADFLRQNLAWINQVAEGA